MSESSRLAPCGWQPADPVRRPVLFVNPNSRGGRAARAGVAERASERGIDVSVLGAQRGLATPVDEAVAHDLIGALDAFTDGVERRIDVAEVNGRLFLNNVSLGIYGDAVRREGYRDAKARTLLETAREVLGPSASTSELQLVDDLGHEHRSPAVVLVSNNPYALDRPPAGPARPALDSGQLGVVVLDAGSPRRAFGRTWAATSLEVTGPGPVHAGVDGEAVDLSPPLRFSIRPAALRVRISPRHPGVSPSGPLP
jgi:diacylglycerol kinase family enzyme